MADSLLHLPTGSVSETDYSRIEPYLGAVAAATSSNPAGGPLGGKSLLTYALAGAAFLILSLPFWGDFSLTQIGIKLAVFIVALILIQTFVQ